MEVGPGKKGRIDITLDTRAMKGRISKTFEVETNDPENDIIILSVYGDIVKSSE